MRAADDPRFPASGRSRSPRRMLVIIYWPRGNAENEVKRSGYNDEKASESRLRYRRYYRPVHLMRISDGTPVRVRGHEGSTARGGASRSHRALREGCMRLMTDPRVPCPSYINVRDDARVRSEARGCSMLRRCGFF